MGSLVHIAALVLVVVAACSRDAKQSTTPRAAEARGGLSQDPPVMGEVPDLQVPMQRADATPAGRAFLVDPGAANPQIAREAVAVLRPTSGHQTTGIVRFRETRDGLEVFTVATNLPQGPHAYHVHVYGDCSAPDASSAGPHFHFTGSSFDKEVRIITGNLGELRGDGTNAPSHQARIPNATLQGPFSIIGRAVVIHAQGNDPQVTPDGGAGDRIACGVIGVGNPEPPQTARR